MFKAGQKVVCIEDFEGVFADNNMPDPTGNPVKNGIYTIFNLQMCNSGLAIYLNEFQEMNSRGFRVSFVAYKFRPLNEQFAESVLENICEEINQEQLQEC